MTLFFFTLHSQKTVLLDVLQRLLVPILRGLLQEVSGLATSEVEDIDLLHPLLQFLFQVLVHQGIVSLFVTTSFHDLYNQ
jgi:hypothetical protein